MAKKKIIKNRVVVADVKQNATEEKKLLKIRPSTVIQIGQGLFAKGSVFRVAFQKGDVIAQYEGKTLTLEDLDKKYPGKDHVAVYVIKDETQNKYIDATDVKRNEPGWFARSANDCTANLNRFSVSQLKTGCRKNNAEFVEYLDGTYLVATQDIVGQEEIWASYGDVYFKEPKADLRFSAQQKREISKLPSLQVQERKETRIKAATRDAHYRNSIAMELIKELLMKDYIKTEVSYFQSPANIAKKVRSKMEIALGRRVMNPVQQVKRALDAFTTSKEGKEKEEDEFEKKRFGSNSDEEDEENESQQKERIPFVYRLKPISYFTHKYMFEESKLGTARTEQQIVLDVKSEYKENNQSIPKTVERDVRTILEYFPQLYTGKTVLNDGDSVYYYTFTPQNHAREKLKAMVESSPDNEWVELMESLASEEPPLAAPPAASAAIADNIAAPAAAAADATIAKQPKSKGPGKRRKAKKSSVPKPSWKTTLERTFAKNEEDIFNMIYKYLGKQARNIKTIGNMLDRNKAPNKTLYVGIMQDIINLLNKHTDKIEFDGENYRIKQAILDERKQLDDQPVPGSNPILLNQIINVFLDTPSKPLLTPKEIAEQLNWSALKSINILEELKLNKNTRFFQGDPAEINPFKWRLNRDDEIVKQAIEKKKQSETKSDPELLKKIIDVILRNYNLIGNASATEANLESSLPSYTRQQIMNELDVQLNKKFSNLGEVWVLTDEKLKKQAPLSSPRPPNAEATVPDAPASPLQFNDIEKLMNEGNALPILPPTSTSPFTNGGSSKSSPHLKTQIIKYLSKKNLKFNKRSLEDIHNYVLSKRRSPQPNNVQLENDVRMILQDKEFSQLGGKWFYQP